MENLNTNNYDCIIIGGGPAGMIASIVMAKRGLRVIIIEKNKILGRKLRITGKGRCNITNSCDFTTLIDNIPGGGKFLMSSLKNFSNTDIIDFFEENGLKTVTERGGRVFPESQKAYDVAEKLCEIIRKYKIPVLYECNASEVLTEEKDGKRTICGIKAICQGKMVKINGLSLLIASGGFTYPLTGSDGNGYRLAKKLGHTVTDIYPSLVAVRCRQEALCKSLMGLSLKNTEIRLKIKNKAIYKDFGEMVFTDRGISGPTVLSMSRNIDNSFENRDDVSVEIDMKPALSEEELDKRILRDFSKYEKKYISNALCDLLPSKMIPAVLYLSEIPENRLVYDINKEERKRLLHSIKYFTLTPVGTEDENQAIVTRGGVNLKEISPSTMESKLIRNLYFAGEILDCDGYTGGFNLTIAFSTGYTAGMNILSV